MMGVYEIVNLVNGKSYVGSSHDIKRRWYQHVWDLDSERHKNSHLQNDWSKYGEGVFSFCVLEQVEDVDDLLDREQYYLGRLFEADDNPYNKATNARASALGREVSEEARRNMSEAGKGRKLSDVTKRKISEAIKGREISKEWRRKISEAKKGRIPHEGAVCNLSKGYAKHAKAITQNLIKVNSRPYPAFVHEESGEIMPAECNLNKLCYEKGLTSSAMYAVKSGKRKRHKGWVLLEKRGK